LPQIAAAFLIKPMQLKIILSVYFLGLALFTPIASIYRDRFGANNIFRVAMIGFIVSSIVCGLSSHVDMLLLFRAIQHLSS